jgi:predicted HTH domain antitoxin
MSVVIPDEWLHAAQMSEAELRLELAIWLYQQGRLTLALASRLAGLTRLQFQRILSERGIPIHYTPDDLAEDLTNLQEVDLQ